MLLFWLHVVVVVAESGDWIQGHLMFDLRSCCCCRSTPNWWRRSSYWSKTTTFSWGPSAAHTHRLARCACSSVASFRQSQSRIACKTRWHCCCSPERAWKWTFILQIIVNNINRNTHRKMLSKVPSCSTMFRMWFTITEPMPKRRYGDKQPSVIM